jgi:hypothetical protein
LFDCSSDRPEGGSKRCVGIGPALSAVQSGATRPPKTARRRQVGSAAAVPAGISAEKLGAERYDPGTGEVRALTRSVRSQLKLHTLRCRADWWPPVLRIASRYFFQRPDGGLDACAGSRRTGVGSREMETVINQLSFVRRESGYRLPGRKEGEGERGGAIV